MSWKTGSALKGSVFVALDQAPVLCLCAKTMNLFSDVFSCCLRLSTSFWNELWVGFPSPPDLELLRIMIKRKWFFFTQRHTTELIDANPPKWPPRPLLQVMEPDTPHSWGSPEAHLPCEPFLATLAVQWASGFSKPLHTHSPFDPCVGLQLSGPRINSFLSKCLWLVILS